MPIPIALLVDDGAPVNPMFFHDPPYDHELLMPNSLLRDFADLCDEYGVRGKFSVLPMPCCLGGIDGQLNHVPPRHLSEFLRLVRKRIAPRFDITPEILTHLAAYKMSRYDTHALAVVVFRWVVCRSPGLGRSFETVAQTVRRGPAVEYL